MKKSSKKPNRKKRVYDNTIRSEKSALTQKTIIETLVTLLVERLGGEVQFDEIAKRSGISERTIFRFFKDKQTLHEAMDKYLLSYLQSGTEQMQSMEFLGFAKNLFKLFDRNESLTMAYLFSPFGQEARMILRRKLTQAMITKIAKEKDFTLTAERKKRLALVTSLVNAKIWYDVRSDFGFTGEEMGDSLVWALETLIENC